MNTYYADPSHNVAFERCIEVMTRMIQKYGPKVLEELREKEQEQENGKEEVVA